MRQRHYTISALLILMAVAFPLRFFGSEGKVGYYECPGSEYDAAIENLFGTGDEASTPYVAVRIFYPELQPETEIVITNVSGTPAVFQRVLTTWLRARVFRRAKPTDAECRGLSQGVKVVTNRIPVSSSVVDELLVSFNAIDLRGKDCVQATCHLPDATGYEVRAGRRRARLIDTSRTNLVSDNQPLLDWVLKLRHAVSEAAHNRSEPSASNSIAIMSFLLSARQSSSRDTTFLGGAPLTIRRGQQCLMGFVGLTSRAAQHDTGTIELQAHISLMPGCEGTTGGTILHGGAWPEFSRKLKFEFELSSESPGQQPTTQPVISELILDDTPPMRENHSVRRFDFNLKADKTSAVPKELLITIFTGDEKLQTFKVPVSTKKSSPSKNRGIRTEGVTI